MACVEEAAIRGGDRHNRKAASIVRNIGIHQQLHAVCGIGLRIAQRDIDPDTHAVRNIDIRDIDALFVDRHLRAEREGRAEAINSHGVEEFPVRQGLYQRQAGIA